MRRELKLFMTRWFNRNASYVNKGFGNKPGFDENEGERGRKTLKKYWRDSLFTDPRQWREGKPFKFIVHTFESPQLLVSNPVLFSSGGCCLSGWDCISASVMSDAHPYCYGGMGVILKVPPQNIIITHYNDIMFRNNIGEAKRSAFDLFKQARAKQGRNMREDEDEEERRLYRIEQSGLLSKHAVAWHRRYGISSPDKILNEPNQYQNRNEVIVITRPGVNIHPGMPVTALVEVKAVFTRDMRLNTRAHKTAAAIISGAAERFNWPCLHISGYADMDDW
ncbi:hypothetical protein ABE276_003445 [Salmonella enterica]